MMGRVKFDGTIVSLNVDWIKLVEKPANEGFFIEAFASADAIIDAQLMNVLRQIFNSHESQTLINQLNLVKEETKFFGSGVLEILENLKVIDEDKLGSKIRDFKGKRNKVVHHQYGEYNLITSVGKKDQIEYDGAVEEEANKSLRKAYEIFEALVELNMSLATKIGKEGPILK